MIYGNRGIGKSSLAQQMMLMAKGHASLIDRLTHAPFEDFDFLTTYIQCDDSIKNIDSLLARILTTQTGLQDWIPLQIREVEGSGGVSASITLEVIKLGAKSDHRFTEEKPSVTSDVQSVFLNALETIISVGPAKSGVLIVIDEFDRIEDRRGLASLLKSLDPKVKVALVGVSTNVGELITEHGSLDRQLSGGCVSVDAMSDEEIAELIDRAEEVMEEAVKFLPDARHRISELAAGHPFLVHLLGRTAAIAALRLKKPEIDRDLVDNALAEIAVKGTASIQESLYKKAVANSYTREVILKEFAIQRTDEIYTTNTYKTIADKLNMADQAVISVYMGQLVSERYGKVLVRTRDRYYRFRDSLFKAYAAARPFLHDPTTTEDEA